MTEPTDLTVAEAAAAVAAGKLSPVELTEAYLARIGELNPSLTAYVEVTADRARSDAASSRRRTGPGQASRARCTGCRSGSRT